MLPGEDKPPFAYMGLVDDYNPLTLSISPPVNIFTASSKLTLGINLLLMKQLPRLRPSVSFRTSFFPCIKKKAPFKTPKNILTLLTIFGFLYGSLVGELMYIYITCCSNIGYHVTTLRKFSTSPAAIRYTMLKNVARHLRWTCLWGLIFCQPTTDPSLPWSSTQLVAGPTGLSDFPIPDKPGLLMICGCGPCQQPSPLPLYDWLCIPPELWHYNPIGLKLGPLLLRPVRKLSFLLLLLQPSTLIPLCCLSEIRYSTDGLTGLYANKLSAISTINNRVPTE